jgi:hypothetical protein
VLRKLNLERTYDHVNRLSYCVLSLSHLLFGDGTLILCRANSDHLCHLRSLLLYFEVVSRLKINLAKSKLVHVAAVEDVEGSSLPMKYLGLPLGLLLRQNQSGFRFVFILRSGSLQIVSKSLHSLR